MGTYDGHDLSLRRRLRRQLPRAESMKEAALYLLPQFP
jgi:hypothetical protein